MRTAEDSAKHPLIYICNSKEKGVFLIWVGKSELANSSKNGRADNKIKISTWAVEVLKFIEVFGKKKKK